MSASAENAHECAGFSLDCERSYLDFLGKTRAILAANEVALSHASESAGDGTRWIDERAVAFRIPVNGQTVDTVRRRMARLYIVALYGVFDEFLVSLKRRWNELHPGSPIAFEEDEDKLTCLLRKIHGGTEAAQRHLGSYLIGTYRSEAAAEEYSPLVVGKAALAALDYYRECRNAVAHSYQDEGADLNDLHKRQNTHFELIRKVLEIRKSAPNAFDVFTLEDAVCFSLLTLATSRVLTCASDPGDEALARLAPIDSFLKGDSKRRARNKAAAWLRTHYGLDGPRSARIAGQYVR